MTPSTRRTLSLAWTLCSGWALYQRGYKGLIPLGLFAYFVFPSSSPDRGRGRSLQRRVRSLSAPPRVNLSSPPKRVISVQPLDLTPPNRIAPAAVDLPPRSDGHLIQWSALPQRASSLLDPLLALWIKRSDEPEVVDGILDLRMATSFAFDWRPLFGTSPLFIELGDIEGAAQRSASERRIVMTEDWAVARQICSERGSLTTPFVMIGRIGQLCLPKVQRIDLRSPSFDPIEYLTCRLQEGGELRLIFKANDFYSAKKWRRRWPLFEESQPIEQLGTEFHLIYRARGER